MTPEAKQRMRQTNIAKYGSEEAWKAHLRTAGRKGGQFKGAKGFAYMKEHDPEGLKELGRRVGKLKKTIDKHKHKE